MLLRLERLRQRHGCSPTPYRMTKLLTITKIRRVQAWVSRATAKPPASGARPAEQPIPYQPQNAAAVASAGPFVGRVGTRLLPTTTTCRINGRYRDTSLTNTTNSLRPCSDRPRVTPRTSVGRAGTRPIPAPQLAGCTAVTHNTSLTNATTSHRPCSDQPRLSPAERRLGQAAHGHYPQRLSHQPNHLTSAVL
jgi:hypothetical protein